MHSLTILTASMVPALGGIGVWLAWKLAHDWIDDREDQRRLDREAQYLDRQSHRAERLR